MKIYVVLALGMLPLAVLTASSLFGRGSADSNAVAADAKGTLDLVALESVAKSAAESAEKEQPAVLRFIELEPFATSTLPAVTMGAAGERFKPVDKAWSELKKAQEACTELASIDRQPLEPKEKIEKMETFLAAHPLKELNGGEDLENYLRRWLRSNIKRQTAADVLDTIRKHYKNKRYRESLDGIEQISPGVLTASEQEELDQYKKKSVFVEYWKNLPSTTESAKTRFKALDHLLTNTPPAADAEDQNVLARKKDEVVQLQRRARVDDLFESPPSRLRELIEECGRILADDPDSKHQLRDGVIAWIENRIGALPPPSYPAVLQEAWDTDGKYLRGVFVKSNSSGSPMYKYWESAAAYRAKNAYDRSLYLSELKSEPAELTEVRICREFNSGRQKLLKKLDSERSWETFAKLCESLQKEVEDYRPNDQNKSSVSSTRKSSLSSSRKLAKEALDEWSTLGKLFK